MKQDSVRSDDKDAVLLRVASYLSQPQKFVSVADARAKLRHQMALVSNGSVVLTTHGDPEVALVSFTTLEDMRRALQHVLIQEMGASLAQSKQRVRSHRGETPMSCEEKLEALVGDAVRKAVRRNGKSSRRAPGT